MYICSTDIIFMGYKTRYLRVQMITPWWIVHGYTYAMVAEVLEIVAHGVRDVVEVWCKVQFSLVLMDKVSPRGRGGKVGR